MITRNAFNDTKYVFLSISLTLYFLMYFLYVLFLMPVTLTIKAQSQCSFPSHLCKLHRSWISENWSIRLLVACVPDQLAVPHPEVMLPVCPLGEDGNSRSAHQRQGVMLSSLWWIYTSNPLIQAVLLTPWNQTCGTLNPCLLSFICIALFTVHIVSKLPHSCI